MNTPTAIVNQLNIDARVRSALRWLSDSERLPKLQRALLLVLVLWVINSAANVVIALIPSDQMARQEHVSINPAPSTSGSSLSAETIDVSSILGADVFGKVAVSEVQAAIEEVASVNPRDGIEAGAQETRLALKLTGIIASTSDGLGSAMIEAKKQQELYVVGDALPANGKVTLAKILPKQVVIDNNGTYELITLFGDAAIVGIVEMAAKPAQTVAKPANTETTASSTVNVNQQRRLASRYRQQLYDDPQSLSGLLSISAVQGQGGLKGYRVSPGRDAAQFTALGFKSGDIVTAVNGYALSDPTNTVRLYQLMRDATDATFEIERDGAPVSISVSLSTIQ
jgi:general secretion pathway protein C